jgi:hypothetical protein
MRTVFAFAVLLSKTFGESLERIAKAPSVPTARNDRHFRNTDAHLLLGVINSAIL